MLVLLLVLVLLLLRVDAVVVEPVQKAMILSCSVFSANLELASVSNHVVTKISNCNRRLKSMFNQSPLLLLLLLLLVLVLLLPPPTSPTSINNVEYWRHPSSSQLECPCCTRKFFNKTKHRAFSNGLLVVLLLLLFLLFLLLLLLLLLLLGRWEVVSFLFSNNCISKQGIDMVNKFTSVSNINFVVSTSQLHTQVSG